MDNKLYQIHGEELSDIADAIRDINDSDEKMTPSEMAEAISTLDLDGDDEPVVTGPVSWNDLLDRPFGEDTTTGLLLESTTCAFTTYIGNGAYLGIPSLPTTLDAGIKAGAYEIKVVWNGEEYTCKPVIANDGSSDVTYYGNTVIMGVEGDDESKKIPFCLYWSHVEGAAPKMYATESGDQTFEIYEIIPVVRTIDPKYLPEVESVSSWNDLKDKPFYEEIVKVALVETFTDEYGDETPNRNKFELTLEEGKGYVVTWDDVEYECNCFVDTWDRLVIGNASLMETGDNTNEPFLIGIQDGGSFVRAQVGGEHTLSISSINETIKTLDEKYLPTAEDEEILNMLIECDAISVVADKNETIIVDKDGNIILW